MDSYEIKSMSYPIQRRITNIQFHKTGEETVLFENRHNGILAIEFTLRKTRRTIEYSPFIYPGKKDCILLASHEWDAIKQWFTFDLEVNSI